MDPDWTKAAAIIAAEEAFVDYPYDDCDPHYPHPRWTGGALLGTATIGYGETDSEVVGGYVSRGDCMTEEEASALLRRRLPAYWQAARADITVDLDPNQAAAVLSMAYNAGPAGMRIYAPDLLAAINERRFADAVEIWKASIVRANGVVLPGLQRRRANEATLFGTPWRAVPRRRLPEAENRRRRGGPPGAGGESGRGGGGAGPARGQGKRRGAPREWRRPARRRGRKGRLRAGARADEARTTGEPGVGRGLTTVRPTGRLSGHLGGGDDVDHLGCVALFDEGDLGHGVAATPGGPRSSARRRGR